MSMVVGVFIVIQGHPMYPIILNLVLPSFWNDWGSDGGRDVGFCIIKNHGLEVSVSYLYLCHVECTYITVAVKYY